MTNLTNDIDVLIVGAGPVGLFLANECARRGLRFRIIEKNACQSQHSKALAIFPRTLEIFDMAGVVEPFLERAHRATSSAVISHGRLLAVTPFEPNDTPYGFIAMVPQDATEKLLAESLVRRGAQVEYETTFVSAVEQAGAVIVTLNRQGDTTSLKASYVVGCDGAHSAIRHAMNLPFEGASYAHTFMLADVETNDALPANQLQMCPSENGPLAIFPMSAHRRRIVATVRQPKGDAPSLDAVRQVLAERAPKGVEARTLYWSTYFRIHHREVRELRRGRFLLAGDAAHIHSPFGGQGMNTGLQDVWNLAWKLDMVVNRIAGDDLLDTYTSERRPIIKQVIKTTDLLTKIYGTSSKLAQLCRDALIPTVSRLAPVQRNFVEQLSELGINYHGSPLVEGVGERYWNDCLRGGEQIKSRFLLFAGEEGKFEMNDATRAFCENNLIDLRSPRGHRVTLVRPDGYVAFSSTRRRAAVTVAHLRSVLQRHSIACRDVNDLRPACTSVDQAQQNATYTYSGE